MNGSLPRWLLVIALLAIVSCGGCDAEPVHDDAAMLEDAGTDASASMDGGPPGSGSFASVHPIFVRRCVGCHTGTGSSGGLALGATAESAHAALVGPDRATTSRCSGPTERITPGDPEQSFVFLKITNTHGGGTCGAEMPLRSGGGLPAAEVDVIRAWILNGAPSP